MIRGIFTCKLSTVFHTLAFMSHREKYVDIIKDGGNLVRVPIKIVVDNHENKTFFTLHLFMTTILHC